MNGPALNYEALRWAAEQGDADGQFGLGARHFVMKAWGVTAATASMTCFSFL